MRLIGYSSGALAKGKFNVAIDMLNKHKNVTAIELSALLYSELKTLIDAIHTLNLSKYEYISIHGPKFENETEEEITVETLLPLIDLNWNIILHPDVICDINKWKVFGKLLCIENMDNKKSFGQTAEELQTIFEELPDASMCFDIGHAFQVDPTMKEAKKILWMHGHRLQEIHMSYVKPDGSHNPLSVQCYKQYQLVARYITEDIPIILESGIEANKIQDELKTAHKYLKIK
jgi:hypothetical protein